MSAEPTRLSESIKNITGPKDKKFIRTSIKDYNITLAKMGIMNEKLDSLFLDKQMVVNEVKDEYESQNFIHM